MAVSKIISTHSFQALLPNIVLGTFIAYLKALSWVGNHAWQCLGQGRTQQRPVGGGGWCPLKYGWMRVGIQDKQFTAQKRWETAPWNYSWDRDSQKDMVLSGLLIWTRTASPDKHALCRRARPT